MDKDTLLTRKKEHLRPDGSRKETGYFGAFKTSDGRDMTEYTIDTHIDGKRVYMPSIVPTLTAGELNHLRSGGKMTMDIMKKAQSHALQRMKSGKSPYWTKGEAVHKMPE